LDGQTCAVDRDALALLDATIPRLDAQFRAVVLLHRLDAAHRIYDSGKHSRRSKTNNVSEPNARRSTTVQRGASASGNAGIPGKAGTGPSPRHTGDWTQDNRSTSPPARSFVPYAPAPSPNHHWIPARRRCAKCWGHLRGA